MSRVPLAQLHRFFRHWAQETEYAVMLGGNPEASSLNQWIVMGFQARQILHLKHAQLTFNGNPINLSGSTGQQTLFETLEAARSACRIWPDKQSTNASTPVTGGLMGYWGYEFYRWCDASPEWGSPSIESEESNWPEMLLCEFEDLLLVHLESGALTILNENSERAEAYRQSWHALSNQIMEDALKQQLPENRGFISLSLQSYLESFSASLSPIEFESRVEQLKTAIQQGEIYQANLSIRFEKPIALGSSDPFLLFEHLCRENPAPFSGFFKWPEAYLISASPERLVKMDDTGLAQTRPIAGTRGRGRTPEEDSWIGQTLLENEKERAEHLMLVDLARNDLGRVCTAGSVTVDELLVLERYAHVTHLVSNVQGQLAWNQTPWALLRSVFPGGTITGCPKIRCISILNQTEPVSRGLYTGSLGYINAMSGALDFNILIRSVFLRETEAPLVYNAAVHVGAGIVHDSVGAHEYRECLRKATALMTALHAHEAQTPQPRSLCP